MSIDWHVALLRKRSLKLIVGTLAPKDRLCPLFSLYVKDRIMSQEKNKELIEEIEAVVFMHTLYHYYEHFSVSGFFVGRIISRTLPTAVWRMRMKDSGLA